MCYYVAVGFWEVMWSWGFTPRKQNTRELPLPSCCLRTQRENWKSMNQDLLPRQTVDLLSALISDFPASRAITNLFLPGPESSRLRCFVEGK